LDLKGTNAAYVSMNDEMCACCVQRAAEKLFRICYDTSHLKKKKKKKGKKRKVNKAICQRLWRKFFALRARTREMGKKTVNSLLQLEQKIER
jgi:hypothetical protein